MAMSHRWIGARRRGADGSEAGSLSRRSALLVGAGAVTGLTVTACGGGRSVAATTKDTGAAPTAPAGPPTRSASASTASAPPGEEGTRLMFIRHAEKPPGSGAPFGLLPDGGQDAESLVVVGWQRAGALVELFDPQVAGGPGAVRDGLVRPAQIVAANPTSGSRRPAQTVTPLSDRLGVVLETSWSKKQTAELAASLQSRSGAVLVSWEHELIPEILGLLGVIDPAPPSAWPDDRFDLVWCLQSAGPGAWTFSQVPQLLLAGDRADPA